jgi:Transglycosylase SLT domain
MVALGLSLVGPKSALSEPPVQPQPAPSAQAGTIADTVCPLVESAARANHVPVALLTRLIWTESRFQAHVVSPKGAQGIAQFMPGTAAEQGLADPFDPEQAIPKAARLVADLTQRFGNLGLAAAAYNAGSNRVADWLAGSSTLPGETEAYVIALTGLGAEDWARGRPTPKPALADDGQSCVEVTASLKTEGDTVEGPLAPWGVQLAGNFSKAIALASFERAEQRYRGLLGDVRPMILGGVMRSRGWRRFYRIMLPEASRGDADRACQAIMRIGGACVPVRT